MPDKSSFDSGGPPPMPPMVGSKSREGAEGEEERRMDSQEAEDAERRSRMHHDHDSIGGRDGDRARAASTGPPPPPVHCWNPNYNQIEEWYSQFPKFAGGGKPFTCEAPDNAALACLPPLPVCPSLPLHVMPAKPCHPVIRHSSSLPPCRRQT